MNKIKFNEISKEIIPFYQEFWLVKNNAAS